MTTVEMNCSPKEAIVLELPYPPSINNYFRKYRNRMVISQKGRAFRSQVCLALKQADVKPISGPVVVKIRAYPPDKRKRDIDNIQKPLLDALEKGNAFYNDCQVKLLVTKMLNPIANGRTIVSIRSL